VATAASGAGGGGLRESQGHNEPVDESIPVTRAVAYGTAKLLPDVDRAHAWLLTLDGAPQSYVDLDDPTHLEFEYARRVGHVLDLLAPPGRPVDAVHLGGGALTLPRYVTATRPGSRQDVVEADSGLIRLVLEHLPLPWGADVAVHAADARAWLATARPGQADVVIGDTFGGSRVPAHLTSLEYARAVERVLRPDGVYVANLADGAPFSFLRGQLATLAAIFGEPALIAEPAVLRGRRFGNVLLVASHRELDITALTRRAAGDAFPARVEHGAAVRRLIGDAVPVRDEDATDSPPPPDGTFSVG
jgi:spermidine synthase